MQTIKLAWARVVLAAFRMTINLDMIPTSAMNDVNETEVVHLPGQSNGTEQIAPTKAGTSKW